MKCLGKDLYEVFIEIVVKVSLGFDGLLFYLYLVGERVFLWNVNV